MKKLIISSLLIIALLTGLVTPSMSTEATGEFRPYLDIIVWGSPAGSIGPIVQNILNDPTRGVYVSSVVFPTSFSKLKEYLTYNGYHVICLLDTDKSANHDIPEDLEKMIEDRCCKGISGLIVSGYLLEPSANNPLIQKIVGAQHKEEVSIGRTIIRVIDMDHEIVRDVAQSFQCHLGTIHKPILYPPKQLIAQTNEGVETVWTYNSHCGSKAGYIALGTSAMAFGNVEIKRIFCHMLYDVMGAGWLQPKEAPLNVRVISGDGKVLIKWEEPKDTSQHYGYRIYRKKGDGEWLNIHDFPLIEGETEWFDNTTENGETYTYKVCSVSPSDDIVACSYLARAVPGKPKIEIDPTWPKPGETIEVVGSEYVVKGTATPGSKVVIEWTLRPSGISGTVETTADEDGNYTAKIPLTPGQTTEYTITVENELGDKETIGPFYVKCIQEQVNMIFAIGKKTVKINGFIWPQDLDTAPFISKNDRTMVPFRFIGERIGAKLDYSVEFEGGPVDKVWYEIDSALDGHVLVEVWINKKTGKRNGIPFEMDQAPLIKNGRTMVPVRFIAEKLGAKVGWIVATYEIPITYPNPD